MKFNKVAIAIFLVFNLLFSNILQLVNAQIIDTIDKNYYHAPLNIPILLAGSFAELRPNHFHGGIDFKTQGKTGLPVFASAVGFVSRIAISSSGYGRVLYIDHPNGTTTVYGHLDRFSEKIESYIRKIQYERESFAVDVSVPEGIIEVNKAEEIAKSGNTGSSAGPHLHYEIRLTNEQKTINPLLFFNVVDKIKPTIQSIAVYPVENGSSVNGKTTFQKFETVLANGTYKLNTTEPIQVWGSIGFGVQTIDFFDGSPNKCGIYSLKLFIDSVETYSFTMNSFLLNETRYINSHIDYALADKSGVRLYKTWLEPGNKLSIYENLKNKGIFDFNDDNIHKIKYEITDFSGNKRTIAFNVKSSFKQNATENQAGELFKFSKDNSIKDEDLVFSIPEGALYSSIYFDYKVHKSFANSLSPVYKLHNSNVPLHFACNLKIRAKKIPQHLHDKLMLAQVDPVSGKIISATGKYADGWVEGNIRSLGNYTIIADTIAPVITPLIFNEQKALKDPYSIKIKITDKISGIKSYRGTIDGNWVLFEYDLKNNIISYTFDKSRMKFGTNHKLNLEVLDYKGNKTSYSTSFFK